MLSLPGSADEPLLGEPCARSLEGPHGPNLEVPLETCSVSQQTLLYFHGVWWPRAPPEVRTPVKAVLNHQVLPDGKDQASIHRTIQKKGPRVPALPPSH